MDVQTGEMNTVSVVEKKMLLSVCVCVFEPSTLTVGDLIFLSVALYYNGGDENKRGSNVLQPTQKNVF